MSSSPVQTAQPVAGTPGFTFVEEDDVLFALSLCREVHRIYGRYHEGSLDATENVWAGLSLTLEMITALQSRVTDGMPAMRLRVAVTQAEEINTVLFGHRLAAGRGLDAARRLALGWTPELPPAGAVPATPDQHVSRPDRVRAFWDRRTAAVRFPAGFLACCLIGVLVDVPFTVMALFPQLFLQLLVVFVGLPVAGWAWHRRRRPAGFAARHDAGHRLLLSG